jgi:hypothetical protein
VRLFWSRSRKLLSFFIITPLFSPRATALSGPGRSHYRDFTIKLRHASFSRTPLDEWSARCRDLYLTTNNKRDRSIPPAGFETKIPASERPAEVRLGPCGHQHQDLHYLDTNFFFLWHFTLRNSRKIWTCDYQELAFAPIDTSLDLCHCLGGIRIHNGLHAVIDCKLAILYENFDRIFESTIQNLALPLPNTT